MPIETPTSDNLNTIDTSLPAESPTAKNAVPQKKPHLTYDIYGDFRKSFTKLVKRHIQDLKLAKSLEGVLAEAYLAEDNKKGYLDCGNSILNYLEV